MIQKAPAWARLWYTALPCAAPDGGDELRCLSGKTVHGSIQRQVLLFVKACFRSPGQLRIRIPD